MNYLEAKKKYCTVVVAPELINFETAYPRIAEFADGSWALEFLIAAKINKIRDVPYEVGCLLSDSVYSSDELVLSNTDIRRITTERVSSAGGYVFAVRGLNAEDEYYFRPYVIYRIGGKDFIIYGDVLTNELLFQVYKPIIMSSLTDEYYLNEAPLYSTGTILTSTAPSSDSELLTWMQENGFADAGITTYYVEV